MAIAAPPAVRRILVFTAAAIFAGATIHHFHWLGGPYFEVPPTIQDHVWPVQFPSRDAIVLTRRAEPLLARGATVTVLTPSEAPNFDQTHWLTALGTLPRQHPVPQKLDGPPETLPRYVLAIRGPFEDPRYRRIAQFPEGFVYERQP